MIQVIKMNYIQEESNALKLAIHNLESRQLQIGSECYHSIILKFKRRLKEIKEDEI